MIWIFCQWPIDGQWGNQVSSFPSVCKIVIESRITVSWFQLASRFLSPTYLFFENDVLEFSFLFPSTVFFLYRPISYSFASIKLISSSSSSFIWGINPKTSLIWLEIWQNGVLNVFSAQSILLKRCHTTIFLYFVWNLCAGPTYFKSKRCGVVH